jgi:hypothetical protein
MIKMIKYPAQQKQGKNSILKDNKDKVWELGTCPCVGRDIFI